MLVVTAIADLQSVIKNARLTHQKIGFVPTMGALHQGHLSLIKQAKAQTSFVVASIFVNPTQFNEAEDFKLYPRTLDVDLKMLDESGCDLVFTPTVEDIYPSKDLRKFDFGLLEQVMEGLHRPGHFNGVAQVVSKLFDAVQADVAFFGQKDFQQFAIIKAMVKQLNIPIHLVACPIVREPSGLAMSSRNQRLSKLQKEQASVIYKHLTWAKTNFKQYSLSELKNEVEKCFFSSEGLELEYFEIVDENTLIELNSWPVDVKVVACVAVFCGKVRLIDNIVFNL